MAQTAIDGDGQRLLRDPSAAERGDVLKIVCLRLLRQLDGAVDAGEKCFCLGCSGELLRNGVLRLPHKVKKALRLCIPVDDSVEKVCQHCGGKIAERMTVRDGCDLCALHRDRPDILRMQHCGRRDAHDAAAALAVVQRSGDKVRDAALRTLGQRRQTGVSRRSAAVQLRVLQESAAVPGANGLWRLRAETLCREPVRVGGLHILPQRDRRSVETILRQAGENAFGCEQRHLGVVGDQGLSSTAVKIIALNAAGAIALADIVDP